LKKDIAFLLVKGEWLLTGNLIFFFKILKEIKILREEIRLLKENIKRILKK
jgi:hypothetical protein